MALTDLPTPVVDLEPPSERRSLGLPPWLRRFLFAKSQLLLVVVPIVMNAIGKSCSYKFFFSSNNAEGQRSAKATAMFRPSRCKVKAKRLGQQAADSD